MSLIVEFSVSSPELTLCETTSSVPSVKIELTDMIGTDPDRPVLFFWVTGDNLEAFDAELETDWSVTNVELYTELGEHRLYRVVLSSAVELVSYPVWVEAGGARLDSTCRNGVWRNRMRFPDRESFDEVRQWCLDNDIEFTLHRLYREADDGWENETAVSTQQARTLELAYENGYYEIPQGTTAARIADDLDISQQAVSERLHRAHATLIEEHIVDDRGNGNE